MCFSFYNIPISKQGIDSDFCSDVAVAALPTSTFGVDLDAAEDVMVLVSRCVNLQLSTFSGTLRVNSIYNKH